MQWSVSTSVLNRIVAGLDLDHHSLTLEESSDPGPPRLDNEHTEDGANPILRSEQPFPSALHGFHVSSDSFHQPEILLFTWSGLTKAGPCRLTEQLMSQFMTPGFGRITSTVVKEDRSQ